MSNCLYNVKAKVDAMRRRADREFSRAEQIRAAAQAKHEEADHLLVDYVTQSSLPELEKAKRALESGEPLPQVINALETFKTEHIAPLQTRFFERRDRVTLDRLANRIYEISDWCSEQRRAADLRRSDGSPGALTLRETLKMNGEA